MMSLENDTIKMQNFKSFSLLFPFFSLTLACEKIFIKTHCIESRPVMGLENVLFADMREYFSSRKIVQAGAANWRPLIMTSCPGL